MANTPAKTNNQVTKRDTITLDALYTEYDVPLEELITEEQKQILADSEQPFWIDDCWIEEGKFKTEDNPNGEYWVFMIRVGDDVRRLHMGRNEKSDLKFHAIKQGIAAHNASAGPARLKHGRNKLGFDYYLLVPAPDAVPASQGELTF